MPRRFPARELIGPCAAIAVVAGIVAFATMRRDPGDPVSFQQQMLGADEELDALAALLLADFTNTAMHDPSDTPVAWLHAMMALGSATLLPDAGTLRALLDPVEAEPIFRGVSTGRLMTGLEAHPGQFLYLLTMCSGINLDTHIDQDRRSPTLRDVLDATLHRHGGYGDASWLVPVMALAPPRTTWANRFGEHITLESELRRLVETESDVCFGFHRLIGIVLALERAPSLPEDLRSACRNVIADSATDLQTRMQPDGRFLRPLTLVSAQPGLLSDRSLDAAQQAHAVEFMVLAIRAQTLEPAEWMLQAIRALCDDLDDVDQSNETRTHGFHALRVYQELRGL